MYLCRVPHGRSVSKCYERFGGRFLIPIVIPQSLQIVETRVFVVFVLVFLCGHSGFRPLILCPILHNPPSVDTNLRTEVLCSLHGTFYFSLSTTDAVHPVLNVPLKLGCVNHPLERRPLVLQLRTFLPALTTRTALMMNDTNACLTLVLVLTTLATSAKRLHLTLVDTD